MKRIAIVILTLISVSTPAQTTFKAYVNESVVGETERFRITFEANDRWSDFHPPDFGPFRVVGGPSQQQSTNIVNGSMSTTFSYSYILQPTQTGTFTIGPARARLEGEARKTNAVEIKVVSQAEKPRDSNDPYAIAERSNILRVFVSKRDVYVGEPITVTYKLYYAGQIRNYTGQTPNLNGFFKEEIELKNQREERENYNGKLFNVATLKKYVLIPQKTGELEIDAFVLDLETAVPTRQRDFFGRPVYQNVSYTAKSPVVKVDVAALPAAGRPSNFSGAVGEYSFEVSLIDTSVTADESATLTVDVSGIGNLKLFELPEPEIPNSIEAYDPKYSERISPNSRGLQGSRKNEYLLIPRFNGAYKIPEMTFSYFDTRNSEYVQLESPQFTLKVTGGSEDPSGVSSVGGVGQRGREGVDYLNEDILFIKTELGRTVDPSGGFRTGVMRWLAYVIGLLAFAGAMIWRRRKADEAADVAGQKRRKARKLATKRLAEAKKKLDAGAHRKFYEEIARALEGYVRDKLQMDLAGLGLDRVLDELGNHGASGEQQARVKELWDTASFARYAPSGGAASEERHYRETLELITELEDVLK